MRQLDQRFDALAVRGDNIVLGPFYRFLMQDVAFGLACAAISVALAVFGLWSAGIMLGDDPALVQAMIPSALSRAP